MSIAVMVGADEAATVGSMRGPAAGHRRIMLDYFWPATVERDDGYGKRGPVFSAALFKRRFRMPRPVFDKIFSAVVAHNAYLRAGLEPDETGRLGPTPLQKVTAALRQLAYGVGPDFCVDYCDIDESTAAQSMKEFCQAMVEVFGSEYLRSPTPEGLVHVEAASIIRAIVLRHRRSSA